MPPLSNALIAAMCFVLLELNHAAPIPSDSSPTPSLSVWAVSSSTCTDIDNCRTMWDIVWSCATTIFLCTWVSFHPSVPRPTSNQARIYAIQIFSIGVAILAPEFVVAKAVMDRKTARMYGSYKRKFQGVPNSR